MAKIKITQETFDKFDATKFYKVGQEVDLGKERNENAILNKKAKWVLSAEVDSSEFDEIVKEKKAEPKKTTSSVKGKKIETK